MITLVGLWEEGWLDYKTEAFMWKQLLSAYAVDKFVMCPARLPPRTNLLQFDDVSSALSELQGVRVYLDPFGGEPLHDFKHPEDAIYIFGRAGDNNHRHISQEDNVVKIQTPKRVDFFAICAASIVLYDRELKNGNRQPHDNQ